MKTQHSTNDFVSPGVHVKAKKQALGELKDLMSKASKGARAGKAAPESAEHAASAFSVTRKAKAGPSLPPAKTLKLHEDVEVDGPAEEEAETPEFEHTEEDSHEGDEAEVTLHADRGHPGDTKTTRDGPSDHEILSDPKKVDRALSSFMVKPKKIKKAF
jgi:hypothetical protein